MKIETNFMQKLKTVLLLTVAIVGLPTICKAQLLIYSDTFTGSGPLDGVQVENSTGQYGGTLNATWNASSNSVTQTLGFGAALNSTTSNQSAYLPFTPEAGYIYTLTATLVSSPNAKTELVFRSSSPSDKYDYAVIQGTAPGSRKPSYFGGPDNTNGGNFGTNQDDGTQTVVLTLNTKGTQWIGSVSLLGDPSATDSYTYTTNPTNINRVGFISAGSGTSSSNVLSFSLYAVPEPSSYAFALMVLGLLAFEIRRRARAGTESGLA
jgi:hypothetical protein